MLNESRDKVQQTFDWNESVAPANHGLLANSSLSPGEASEHGAVRDCEVDAPHPLLCPDRQIVYADAKNHYGWPSPDVLHNRNTITVDRISDDTDVCSHRFVIERGDTVEVFFSASRRELGSVVGISHAREEVRVRFERANGGIWFFKGQIYPAPPSKPQPSSTKAALSQVILDADKARGVGGEEADRLQATGHPSHLSEDQVASTTPNSRNLGDRILAFLSKRSGRPINLRELRAEFGETEVKADAPELNPVNSSVKELRDKGKIHVDEPRFGEPLVSVLTWPTEAKDFSKWSFPNSLSGAEVVHLMNRFGVTIEDLSGANADHQETDPKSA